MIPGGAGDCLSDQLVAELVGGAVDASRRAASERHIDHCSACRALVARQLQAQVPTCPDVRGTPDGWTGRDLPTPRGARGTVPPAGFPGTDRFQLGRWIGGGGMGVVYEVLDTSRGEHVALKTLRLLTPDQLLRFKHEFRAMRDLHHPNFVTLGELMEADGTWFFTMELVRGVDFLAHVRPQPQQLDEARLRDGLAQLVEAVAALHAAGKVHRDIKPSNVLVAQDGRVVLLDFGLVADVDGAGALSEEQGVGTAYYMAPEQGTGEPVGPPADWYAVGVMLHEALTGRLPFGGTPMIALMAKMQEPPPSPAALAAAHGDLGALCGALLARAPGDRPDAAAIRAALHSAPVALASEAAPFVGRRRELAALERGLARVRAGAPVAVRIDGDSGIGKSALVRQFLAGQDDVTVLAGRCHERELVPFKALDGVIDALTRLLRHMPDPEVAALLGADADLVARVFPVLDRVPSIARRARGYLAPSGQQLRTRMFAALQELLGRLAAVRPLVLAIDDLQWTDADSLLALEQIARGPAPVLLIATARTGWDPPAWLGDVVIRLDGLDAAESAELVERLGRQWRAAPARIGADAAGGHPLWLAELVRCAARDGGDTVDLDQALRARIARLPAESRELLEIIAIAGAAIPPGLAAAAANLASGDGDRHHATLRAGHLVRTGAGGDTVDTYHDAVREAVQRALPADVRKARHRALALAAEAVASSLAPELLAVHWQEAGDLPRAAEWAQIGGARAHGQLAFEHAARLLQLAVDLTGGPGGTASVALLAELGDVLALAGRGRQAADAYLAAAARSDAAGDLRRRAAEQLLLSGHVDDGKAVLRQVIADAGLRMPASERRALVQLLIRRARLALRRKRVGGEPRPITDADRTRLDVCASASTGLVAIDPVQSSFFRTQELLLALRVRDPARVARALPFEVSYLAATRGPAHPAVRRALGRARDAARAVDDPYVDALVDGNAAAAAVLGGDWRDAIELAARAERTLRDRCITGAWELDVVELLSLTALWYVGRLGELSREVPRRLRDACERGDRFSSTNLRSGLPFAAFLIRGDDDAAERELAAARRDWSQDEFHVPQAQMLHADVMLALYRGDADRAGALLAEARPAMDRTLLRHILLHRIVMCDLDGRVALARAFASGDERERRAHLATADRAARRLGRERVPWARALGVLLDAQLLAAGGARDRAVRRADDAAAALRACDMRLHEAIAGRLRGTLLASPEQIESCDAWLRGQGVASPEALAAALAPAVARERWR